MKDFDKHIKQTLDKHGSPVDTDKLWKGLESAMDAPVKAPMKPWILPLITTAVLSAGLWFGVNYFSTDNSSTLISDNNAQTSVELDIVDRTNVEAVTDISAESATGDNPTSSETGIKAGNKSSSSIASISENLEKIASHISEKKKSSSDKTINKSEKKNKKSEAKKPRAQSASYLPNEKATDRQAIPKELGDHDEAWDEKSANSLTESMNWKAYESENKSSYTAVNDASNTVSNTASSKTASSSPLNGKYSHSETSLSHYGFGGYNTQYTKRNYANPIMNADRATRSSSVEAKMASASEARAYNKYKEKLQRNGYYDLPKLPVIATSRSTFTRKGHRASDAFKIRLKKNDCPTFPVRNAILFTDFGMGLSLSRKSFTDKGDFGLLSDLRHISETPSITSQARLNFGIKHKSGLAFMAGLSAYRLTEKFDYTVIINSDSTFNDQGELLYVIDTEKDVTEKNSYTLYDIPLTLEYTRRTGTRWSSGIQLGVIPNIALKTKGVILNPNETLVDIAENQNQVFKPRIGLSYFASVSANYLISDNYYIYFAPYARVMPESFTQNSYGIDQNYELWGANIGLRYFFGKGDF